jgi:hypothetical protein
MATKVYESEIIETIDGEPLEITPLKIKYLRDFLVEFDKVKSSKSDDETIGLLVSCATICMRQYAPNIATSDQLEDAFDLKTVYKIINVAAGIQVDGEKEESVTDQAKDSGSSWEDLDLAKIESEVFLLGIWKDYEDLEVSLSMPELLATLTAKRDLDYQEKKFLAAMQGVDLDKQTGKAEENAWEKMKARVFSNGKATSSNDVTALQGYNAQKAGFGIGMGLQYEDLTKKTTAPVI